MLLDIIVAIVAVCVFATIGFVALKSALDLK